jgi:hypothetical protein
LSKTIGYGDNKHNIECIGFIITEKLDWIVSMDYRPRIFYYIHTRNPKRRFPRLLLWVGVRMPFVILSRLWSSAAVSVIGWLKSTLILRLLMLLVAWTVLACSRITTWEFPNAVQTFTMGCVRSGEERKLSNWCERLPNLGQI